MSKLYRVGLSFPGDLRKGLVSEVAKILAFKFAKNYTQDGQDLVLYDHYHKDQFNLPELSKELPDLYRDQCEVIAVFRTRSGVVTAPAQDCTPDGPSLSDQAAVLCVAELRDPAAVMASPHRCDGQSRPAPGTARHRGPVA